MTLPNPRSDIRSQAFRYIDGELPPAERVAFEASCRRDHETKEALVEALTLKGLARIADGQSRRRRLVRGKAAAALLMLAGLVGGITWAASESSGQEPQEVSRSEARALLRAELTRLAEGLHEGHPSLERVARKIISEVNPIALQSDVDAASVELLRECIRIVGLSRVPDPAARLWTRSSLFHASPWVVATAATWYPKVAPGWELDPEASGVITGRRHQHKIPRERVP